MRASFPHLTPILPLLEKIAGGTCQQKNIVPVHCRTGELYCIPCNNKRYALKIYKEDDFYGDITFYSHLKNTTIPIPRVYAHDDTLSIISYPWIILDWLDAGESKNEDPYTLGQEIGRYTKEIHQVQVEGAGAFTKSGWEYTSWKDFVRLKIPKIQKKISQFPEDKQIKSLFEKIIRETIMLGNALQPKCTLLHGDLGLDNILHQENTVIGFIDTGWCIGGHPILDVATFINSSTTTEAHILGFREGYDMVGIDAYTLGVFRLYLLIGKIAHFLTVGDMSRYEVRKDELLLLYGQLANY